MFAPLLAVADGNPVHLQLAWVDYLILTIYFVFVLGIGWTLRRSVRSSEDFFLSGRSIPAWIAGLAFISANLGAVEIMGMSASGAEFGLPTVHYFWIGAIPAKRTRASHGVLKRGCSRRKTSGS